MQAQDKEPNSTELLQAPIIDEHLSELLSARGVKERQRQRTVLLCFFLAGMPIGLIPTLFGVSPQPLLVLLFAIAAIGWIVGAFKQYEAEIAMAKRDYDRVAALLPGAMMWNRYLMPLTYFQVVRCSQMLFNLLLSEGRYVEFEALARYAWGLNERKVATKGMPRHFAIANNLAVAFLCQRRYAEAATMFEQLRLQAKGKQQQLFVLNNLAACQVKSQLFDAAQATVDEAMGLHSGKLTPFLSARFDYTSALVCIHRSEFDKAEALILRAEASSARGSETVVMRALCQAAQGMLRLKQQRADEAELFYKNALALLESMSYQPYATLADVCTEYAACLDYAGKHEQAALQKERAANFIHENFMRESISAQAIAKRLTDRRRIFGGIELCDLTDRTAKRLGKRR